MKLEPIPLSLWHCVDCGLPGWGGVEKHAFDNKLVCTEPQGWVFRHNTLGNETICFKLPNGPNTAGSTYLFDFFDDIIRTLSVPDTIVPPLSCLVD